MRILSCPIFFIISCISASAFAEFESGVYGTLSLGANWGFADWDGISSIDAVNDTGDALAIFESWTPNGATSDDAKFMGNVGLGYQLVDGPLYLGAQISGTFSDKRSFAANETHHYLIKAEERQVASIDGTSNTQTQVSLSDTELDFDLKPGYIFADNFLVYARIGVAFTQLDMNSAGVWTAVGTTYAPGFIQNTNQASDANRTSKDVAGFRAGLGAEYLLSEHIGLSLDYIFTDYGDISMTISGEDSDAFSGNHVAGIHSPTVGVTTHAVLLGITVHQ
ncbi:MAG: outer membrane beta-barrel protein [Gammaproteobacteria bacterium]|jgi:opacity protein-like surface antigen